ncbi:hypothetical protein AB0O72_12695 [Streptomyces sp. NPDC088106]|uniref:hypothetical protein n=1 Tax=Streptomyces TaxID=1883 RepID=UPI00344A46D2
MARPYDPGPKRFVFAAGDGNDHQVSVNDDQAERAELLELIEFLGIERVDAPAGAAGGEVWVRTDARLDAECARWA